MANRSSFSTVAAAAPILVHHHHQHKSKYEACSKKGSWGMHCRDCPWMRVRRPDAFVPTRKSMHCFVWKTKTSYKRIKNWFPLFWLWIKRSILSKYFSFWSLKSGAIAKAEGSQKQRDRKSGGIAKAEGSQKWRDRKSGGIAKANLPILVFVKKNCAKHF